MNWRQKASCKDKGIDVFFNRRTESSKREQEALCGNCPVAKECLEFALKKETAENVRIGIWGGLTPEERSRLKGAKHGKNTRQRNIN
jgi:WhiB family redox-sensing transcriptional regulator